MDMVPEALEGLEELVAERDRVAITKLLLGTQVLMPKGEQILEHNLGGDRLQQRSKDEMIYWLKHKHWPEEETSLALGSPCPDKRKSFLKGERETSQLRG